MLQMEVIQKLKTSYVMKVAQKRRLLSHTMGSKTVIYDTDSWEKVTELFKPKHPGNIMFSKDNNYFYIKSTTGAFCVYGTIDFKLIKSIQSSKSRQFTEGSFALTDDPFIIIDTIQTKFGNQLAVIDVNEGSHKVITDFEDSITLFDYHQYVADESYHLFTVSYVNPNTDFREYKLLKIDLSSQDIVSLRHPNISYWDSLIFSSVHKSYIMIHDNHDLIISDYSFKKVLKRKTLFEGQKKQEEVGYFRHINQSPDGNYIIVTYSEMVIIIRYADLEIVRVEALPSACFGEFSEDNQYLLIGTWTNGYVLKNNLK
ncbi:hypothetical protein [Pseudobacillus wudalianchiensis]|uniref:Uncharacterized protein n=1 Tax=Pseudobacillus wudalianchiensis TaxID=1743143 RepID=A0A1B9B907_9BACI|nr:hypothetical protein [Bacillus wudalianchiensis]OCA92567.1 hypothetical protein A8F95_02395 [Bacillus wudalianchiensis]